MSLYKDGFFMSSQGYPDTYSTPEGTINIFTKYREQLLNEQKTLEGEELNMKNLLLYERWKVQELKESKTLQNKFSELQVENQKLEIKYNELLKEKNDVEMKLNSERFENFEFETNMRAEYAVQIENLLQEHASIRSIRENLKKKIENYKIEIKKLQDPQKKLTLDELKILLNDIRHQNKRLAVENEVLEKRNIWFRNQINNLVKEIDLCKKKITEINEQRSKRYRFRQSGPDKREQSKREEQIKRKEQRKRFNEMRKARGEPLLPKSDDDSDDDDEEHEVKGDDQVLQEALDILEISPEEQDNPYKILGLNQNATRYEIKKAFQKLSLRIHPDKHYQDPSYVQAQKWVTEAYETLMLQFPVNSLYNISLDSLFDQNLVFAEFNSTKFHKSRDVYQYCV